MTMVDDVILTKGKSGDIEFKIVKASGKISAIVKCPRCGEYGTLQRSGTGFKIQHKRRRCHFGWSAKEWDQLKEIYEIREMYQRSVHEDQRSLDLKTKIF